MNMTKMSVQQAAERLGVSPARVRQRIDAGTLVAEKVGGRWLVDLAVTSPAPAQAGRPVSPTSVWWSLVALEIAKTALPAKHRALLSRMRIAEAVLADLEPAAEKPPAADGRGVLEDFASEARRLSRSSRNRAVRRLAEAVESRDHDSLLAWLSNRSSRRLLVAAPSDLNALREDPRLVRSGLSDPRSGMDDLRLLEGYVKADDVDAIASDYWLELPSIDDRPNVVLHVSPMRPPAIGPMLLAADLAEHGGPRELVRAHELLDEAIDALVPTDGPGIPA